MVIQEILLRKLYIEDNLSIVKIQKLLKVSQRTVQKYLKLYNIPVKKQKILEDITNQEYENLTVKYLDRERTRNNRTYWYCQCRCGSIKSYAKSSLVNGLTTSCGCVKKALLSKRSKLDLSNKTFGKIYVIKEIQPAKTEKGPAWWCRCLVCDKEFKSFSRNITRNKKGCELCRGLRLRRDSNFKEIPLIYYNRLNRGAIARNIDFEIIPEDIWNQYLLQDKKCKLCGIDIIFCPKAFHTQYRFQTASVDRIDSSKGYTKDNIQIIHKDLNKMKSNFDNDYFIEMCKKVSNEQTKRSFK